VNEPVPSVQPLPSVLFVDDDALVLQSLKRSSRRDQPPRFRARFVLSGAEALDRLEESPADVVVSDMVMPGMDGATLLSEVRRRWPATIRFVLSGHMNRSLKVRALPVAHLVLSKPCEYRMLRSWIERGISLRRRLASGGLAGMISQVENLPVTPHLYSALTEAMGDPRIGLSGIAAIVDQDPAIAGRVLQLANSAWVGLPRNVGTTWEALRVLGIDLLRKLVLSAEVFEGFARLGMAPSLDLHRLRRHAVATARIAGELADPDKAPLATTAGLLHDIGKLALSVARTEEWSQARRRAQDTDGPIHLAEQSILGCDHADAGAALLDLWGLPLPATQAVADHHAPHRLRPGLLDVPGLVYAANVLATAASEGRVWELARGREDYDPAWVSRFDDATMTRWSSCAERIWMELEDAAL
jgi:putative nucleotidyltransferase with HDIG domain